MPTDAELAVWYPALIPLRRALASGRARSLDTVCEELEPSGLSRADIAAAFWKMCDEREAELTTNRKMRRIR